VSAIVRNLVESSGSSQSYTARGRTPTPNSTPGCDQQGGDSAPPVSIIEMGPQRARPYHTLGSLERAQFAAGVLGEHPPD